MDRVLLFIGLLHLCAVTNARIFQISGERGYYSLTFWQAYAECKKLGAALASPNELKQLHKDGYSKCSCGWLSDHTAVYPINQKHTESCNVGVGIHNCDWRDQYNAFCVTYDNMETCTKPLGIETGQVRNEQFTTSSVNHAFWGEPWSAGRARLNKGGLVNAWMPNHDGKNQYLQIDLERPMAITGIMTQGAKRYTKWQYVTKYKVAFTRDGNNWNYYLDGKILDGNSDNDGHVRNWFNPPILTSSLRIYPHSWYNHITLRLELFGCTLEEHDMTEDAQGDNKY